MLDSKAKTRMLSTRNLNLILYICCLATKRASMNNKLDQRGLWRISHQGPNGTQDDSYNSPWIVNLQQGLHYNSNARKEVQVQVQQTLSQVFSL